MNIKQDIKNELFKRQELTADIEADKNPSFAEVKKQLSKQLSKPEENINILNVRGSFGSNVFTIDAYVYDSKEELEKMKKLTLTKKQKKEETEKPTQAPIEEKPEQEQKAVKEEQQAEEESKEP